MKLRRRIALLLSLALMLGVLAGCGNSQTSSDPKETKYLQLTLTLSETLNSIRSTFVDGHQLAHRLLFSSLLAYDVATSSYVNVLADKVDVSADGLTYTVTLGNHKFHDGSAITADDVVFTYTMAIRANANNVNKLTNVAGYKALLNGETDTLAGLKKVNDKTVTFTLTSPDSLFMSALAYGNFAILPSKLFQGKTPTEVREDPAFWTKPVGSGAYMVNETNYPSYITLTRYDKYYKPAAIKDVLLTYYEDTASQQAAWIAGKLDYGTNFTEDDANNLCAQNADLTQKVVTSVYQRWFNINWSGKAGENGKSHPSLGDARVRQAINMAIDKDAIVKMYGSLAVAMTTRVNPSMPEYNSDIPVWKRDVAGAKKLLDEAKFDYSTPLRFYSSYTTQVTTDFFELIKQNLAEVGVQMTYVQDKNHQAYLPVTDYDLALTGGNYPFPVEAYSGQMRSSKTDLTMSPLPIEDPGFDAYWIPRYDELITAWKATIDPAKQKELIDKLQYNAYEDMAQIPLYGLDNINLYNSAHVSGIPPYARDYEYMVDLKLDQWKLLG